jgi:hypothetical protein
MSITELETAIERRRAYLAKPAADLPKTKGTQLNGGPFS